MSQHDQSAVRSTCQVLVNAHALLRLGAAAHHVAVVPEHLEEYLPFGLFFRYPRSLCGPTGNRDTKVTVS
jgi:hypothetical protein